MIGMRLSASIGPFVKWCRLRDYSALRASPLRGRRRTTAFNVAARRCRTQLVCLSGVRIVADDWHAPFSVHWTFCKMVPAEGLLGAARLAPPGPLSDDGVQRRCATLSNPACLSVGGSNRSR